MKKDGGWGGGGQPHSNERKWQDPRSEENAPYHSFLCVVSEKEMDVEENSKGKYFHTRESSISDRITHQGNELALLSLQSARGPSGRTGRIFYTEFIG